MAAPPAYSTQPAYPADSYQSPGYPPQQPPQQPMQQPAAVHVTVPAQTTTTTTTQVVTVGNCPVCHMGTLREGYSLVGILIAILLFPIGVICCLLMTERKCSHCGAHFGA